jgi:hypothetical protein
MGACVLWLDAEERGVGWLEIREEAHGKEKKQNRYKRRPCVTPVCTTEEEGGLRVELNMHTR